MVGWNFERAFTRPISRWALAVGAVLLSADAVFMVLTALHLERFGKFDVSGERSYAEQFQYFQLGLFVVALAMLAWQRRRVQFVAWAAIYAYLLFDDAFKLHERSGKQIVKFLRIDRRFNVEPYVLGEVAFLGFVVCASAALVTVTARIDGAGPPFFWLCAVSAGFALAGGFFDFWHSKFDKSIALSLLEDGGEMLAASAGVTIGVAVLLGRTTISSRELRLLTRRA